MGSFCDALTLFSVLCAPGLTELQKCFFGDVPSPWLRIGELLSTL